MKATILPLAVCTLFAGALSVNTADAAPKHKQDPRKEHSWGHPSHGQQAQTGHRPHSPKHQSPAPKHDHKAQSKHKSPAPKHIHKAQPPHKTPTHKAHPGKFNPMPQPGRPGIKPGSPHDPNKRWH